MESAGLRHRAPDACHIDLDKIVRGAKLPERSPSPTEDLLPPRYTIDLSLPPEQRYNHLSRDFRSQVGTLPELFDEVIASMVNPSLVPWVRRFARLTLRRVYSNEETRELRGISRSTGVNMYLLVAFNVLLDLFMGCTSGGARVEDMDSSSSKEGVGSSKSRMLHFRCLDWGMDPLRRIVVELDFVREKGGPVVGTSVTYFGYVGVLTGVRRGLSISLNFRPQHDATTRLDRIRWTAHLLLVLFGFRRSISSVLRGHLLPDKDWTSVPKDIAGEVQDLPSTAAYLIFCTGAETISIEKDHCKAKVERSKEYIVTLNHDTADEETPYGQKSLSQWAEHEAEALNDVTGMSDIVEFSISRKKCAVKLWRRATSSQRRENRKRGTNSILWVTTGDIVRWMEGEDITNEETHYAVIMDAEEGTVIWRRRWLESKN